MPNKMKKLCECGCGAICNNRFLPGHNRRGGSWSPRTRAKMSASHKGQHRIFSPEHKAKIKAAMRSKKIREKMRVILKHLWQNSEYRARMQTNQKGRTPEQKAKLAENLRQRWQNPGYRARMMALWQNPEYCAKIIGASKRWVPAGSIHYDQGRVLVKTKSNNWRYRSHLVMEQIIGRPLLPEEVVHHINGIVDDGREENLMLFSSTREHSKWHANKRRTKYANNNAMVNLLTLLFS